MLTLEDGTIVENANTYALVASATTYHKERGNDSWADASNSEKEAALINATQSLDVKYRGSWYGVKTNNNDLVSPQGRAWPRKLDTDTDTPLADIDGIDIEINSIPYTVVVATYEVALIELSGSFLTKELSKNSGLKRKKTDVLESEWFEASPAAPQYPYIDEILYGLTSPAGAGVSMTIGLTVEEVASMTPTDPTSYL